MKRHLQSKEVGYSSMCNANIIHGPPEKGAEGPMTSYPSYAPLSVARVFFCCANERVDYRAATSKQ